jgi:hypothetical protein
MTRVTSRWASGAIERRAHRAPFRPLSNIQTDHSQTVHCHVRTCRIRRQSRHLRHHSESLGAMRICVPNRAFSSERAANPDQAMSSAKHLTDGLHSRTPISPASWTIAAPFRRPGAPSIKPWPLSSRLFTSTLRSQRLSCSATACTSPPKPFDFASRKVRFTPR